MKKPLKEIDRHALPPPHTRHRLKRLLKNESRGATEVGAAIYRCRVRNNLHTGVRRLLLQGVHTMEWRIESFKTK